MNYLTWLMRAKQWAASPPSAGRVKLVLGVILLCLLIVGYERIFGWPEGLAVDGLKAKP